jgi:hypothetical protein
MVVITLHKGPMTFTSSLCKGPSKFDITLHIGPLTFTSSVVQRSFNGCYYVA